MGKKRLHSEIMEEICRKLIENGINFETEHFIRLSKDKAMRADIAILYNGRVACLVEVKRNTGRTFKKGYTKQYMKYMESGYQFLCCGQAHKRIDETIEHITDILRAIR